MGEILVKAIDATHSDATKDRRGTFKGGMPVVVMEDEHKWGAEERLPKFVLIKVPEVPVEKLQKYIQPQTQFEGLEADGITPKLTNYRSRLWQIRWADLPQAARNKLSNAGVLTIKAGSYAGAADYTWAQVKAFFHNLETDADETGDLT